MRRVAAALPLAALFLLIAPSPASAATYAQSGLRCTKVGTSGADRLTGTSGRDVLCSLGGNDVLSGYGGDDVLDGGSGNDTLHGSTGLDILYGGSGADVLTGDAGADKAYGGTGNDRVYGGDGSDLLYGQDGTDQLSGGYGADRAYGGIGDDSIVGGPDGDLLSGQDGHDNVLGGLGNDELYGAAGSDVLSGQDGADYLSGGDAADKAYGGPGTDTLVGGLGDDLLSGDLGDDTEQGGYGNDKLYGSAGADVLSGEAGADYLSGGDDADKESGGAGNDTMLGESGDDTLAGDDGDDDLSGQGGRNTLAGGSGTNWCVVGPTDSQTDCVYDAAAPTIDVLTVTPTEVDVTLADAWVTLQVRVLDDTGVAGVQAGVQDFATGTYGPGFGVGTLVSGNLRDGVWQLTGRVPRYSLPADYDVVISAGDRIGRAGVDVRYDVFQVHDDTPDRANAVVLGAALSTTSVDVRSTGASVTTTVEVNDDLAGVDSGGVVVCLHNPTGDGGYAQQACEVATRVSGTRLSGSWRAVSMIPKGSVGGDWNVTVSVSDVVRQSSPDYYVGPDYSRWRAQSWPGDRYWHDLPGGVGRVSVVGTTDSTPAHVEFVRTDVTRVDTLQSAQTVNLDVHVFDAPGEGAAYVTAYLKALDTASDGSAPQFYRAEGALVSGSAVDGWWRLAIALPQGAPPGRYALSQVIVEDPGHWRSYTTAGSPYAGQPDQLTLDPSQLGTADGGAWDGIVVVGQESP